MLACMTLVVGGQSRDWNYPTPKCPAIPLPLASSSPNANLSHVVNLSLSEIIDDMYQMVGDLLGVSLK